MVSLQSYAISVGTCSQLLLLYRVWICDFYINYSGHVPED